MPPRLPSNREILPAGQAVFFDAQLLCYSPFFVMFANFLNWCKDYYLVKLHNEFSRP